MTGRIPAIETRAYGCRFRSRLEARWAVFFTEAGFTWEYEPEGVYTSTGGYLCDFRVTGPMGVTIWVEVKPVVDTVDDPRWADLARSSGLMLFTVRGMHRSGDDCTRDHSARVFMPDGTVADVHRLWRANEYERAWDAASAARFDGKDAPGRTRKGRRGRG